MQKRYLFTILALLFISLIFLYKTFRSPKLPDNNTVSPNYTVESAGETSNKASGGITPAGNGNTATRDGNEMSGGSDQKMERKIIIKGRVIDIFGNGVPSAKVSWALDAKHARNQSNYKSSTITTNDEGYFLIEQIYDAAESSEVSIKLHVNDNEKGYYSEQKQILLSRRLETKDVTLRIIDTIQISFKAISDRGPVENANITIYAEPNFSVSGNTDIDGKVLLTVPGSKQLNITCISKGYLTWNEILPAGSSQGQVVEIYLKSGSGIIYGRCLTENGIPIKNVKISVWNSSEKLPVPLANFSAQDYTVSDSNGYFTINNLPEGKIGLSFSHPQYKHNYLNADTTTHETIIIKMVKTYRVSLFIKTTEQMKTMKYGEDFIFEIKDQENKAIICSWKREQNNDFTSNISFEPARHMFKCKFFNDGLNKWEDYYTREFIIYEDTEQISIDIR